MARRKTAEEAAWLRERYPAMPNSLLLDLFRLEFGWAPSPSGLASWASDEGLRKAHRAVKWREHPEYDEFMREFAPGRSEGEIADGFRERFGIELTPAQIGNRKAALGVRSGTCGGRFEKGHVPPNKGRTWDELGYDDGQRARMRSGQFRKGNVCRKAMGIPVGSERVSEDGYIEVKVRERSPVPCTNKCWELKHRVVWEEANGRKLRPDECVVFVDQDRRNLDPSNLRAITRAQNIALQRMGRPYADAATLDTALAIAELRGMASRAERAPRRCRACGVEFEPRFARQRTCDACLGKRRKEKDGDD